MLATTGIPATLEGWVGEPKLDGWRARVLVDGDDITLHTRSGRAIPGSVGAVAGLSGLRVVIDGELVASSGQLDDFYRLGPPHARRPSFGLGEVTFVAFDLLWADGDLLVDQPYEQRRNRLVQLDLPALGVPVMPAIGWADLPKLFKACVEQGAEGIVLKERTGRYLPGKRSAAWRKVNCGTWLQHRAGRAPRSFLI